MTAVEEAMRRMKNRVCARLSRVGRMATRAVFFLPFAVASFALLWSTGPGQAQIGAMDPLQQLRSGTGQGIGGLQPLGSGNYVGQQPDMAPQVYMPDYRSIPLPTSRLEQILSARAGVKLKQFGYDQLGNGRSVTVAQTGAVPDDYVLGPGDQVVMSLRGQENSEFRVVVDRNGQVVLPRLKPIPAIGRSFGSFRQDLEAAVHRAYVATDAVVSIATVRQIRVLVSGEVNNPGERTLSGLSSAVDALLLSGGVRKTGTLRNVRIQRAGREYVVDLYNVLTTRGGGTNLRLADGDRILVAPLGRTVAVSGLVRQPGIYELPSGQSSIGVRALLQLAGGQEVRGRYRMSVLRIQPDGQTLMEPMANDTGVVRDSEILFAQLGADLAASQATLSGGTGLAGSYALRGTRLSEVLRAPGAMGQSPYTLFGLIVRKDPHTLLRTLVPFTPVAVLSGAEDQQLQPDDNIRVLSVNEAQLMTFVVKTYLSKLMADQNLLRDPQAANANLPTGDASATPGAAATPAAALPPLDPNDPALLTARSQQFNTDDVGLEDFVNVPSEMQRADITALLNMAAPGSLLAHQQTAAFLNRRSPDGKPTVSPASIDPQVQQQQAFDAQYADPLQQQPADAGQFRNTGLDPQQNIQNQAAVPPPAPDLGANYMDVPVAPGGFASNREVQTFGQLVRQLGVDPLVLINFLIDNRVRLDGAVAGPGFYFVGPNVPLKDLVQAAGGTANWADQSGVELTTTAVDNQSGHAMTQRQTLPLRQGTLASYTVRPRDHLRFNRVYTEVAGGSITVQGEVRFAGSYSINKGERLSEVLMRAGGLTGVAYPAGTVYLRKSAAATEHDGYMRAANEIQEQLLAGMSRVGADKIPPETFTAMQSFIGRLRTQKAAGRVSFIADPSLLAARPELDPLVEAGDVIYIPQRPTTVAVMGEVMQPGSYLYRANMSLDDYIGQAGGLAQFSNDDMTFVVMPDGTARKMEKSLFGFDSTKLPPGSTIVVPRDLAILNTRQIILDVTGIFSQLAVSLASLAVISRN
jgi:protein involved in polysaccharide export with SLBB domain